ncbi:MAG: FadR family transcriptional regulator [Acidobacteriota bacterium]|nr:FadR family transcriptional regulator [Acidobacteriota bacterium]
MVAITAAEPPGGVRPKLSAGQVKTKRAATVADSIVADVIARGWPVGQVLGSEPELLERYGVSRAVFREAVRLVENQQVARMRRGPGGGLVVAEPTVEAIIDATVLYLYRAGTRLDEVFEARMVLEDLVCQLAPSRCDETHLAALQQVLAEESAGTVTDHRALHAVLAAATLNPALGLFTEILNRVTTLYFGSMNSVSPKVGEASRLAHVRIVEAVAAGDEGLARHRMRRHLEAEADFIQRRRSTRMALDPTAVIGAGRGAKRAEEVAREVFQSIVADGLQPGDMIGSESELMERFKVSRAVVREAVRLLEHHNMAAMKRGPGGGLFVSAPSVLAVTAVMALYLERHGIRISDIFEIRAGVELAVVDLAVARMDDASEARLQECLRWEVEAPDEEFTSAAHDIHMQLAAMSGNHALELLSVVLIRLTHLHERENLSPTAVRALGVEVSRTHGAIVEALARGDRQLSRHRMSRHLSALSGYFR